MFLCALLSQYSPEVADVGCVIACRVGCSREDADGNVLRMASPVAADAALAEETAQLEAAGGHTFFVVRPHWMLQILHSGRLVMASAVLELCKSCARLVSVIIYNSRVI